jgi:hypothetical protein
LRLLHEGDQQQNHLAHAVTRITDGFDLAGAGLSNPGQLKRQPTFLRTGTPKTAYNAAAGHRIFRPKQLTAWPFSAYARRRSSVDDFDCRRRRTCSPAG